MIEGSKQDAIFARPDYVDAHLLRKWDYFRCKFSVGFATFDELEYGPIDMILDSFAGSISQSAKGNHHFLVESAYG